jgi:hypothetical protein
VTTATPLVQFPWPLVFAGVVGFALALVASRSGRRGGGPVAVVGALAAAVAGAAAGAFIGLLGLWGAGMSNPIACLYSCDEGLQFLSNEQFRQMMLMTDLAWILPAVAVVSAAVAVTTRLSRRGGSAGCR